MGTVATKYFDYGQEEIDYLKSVDRALGGAITRLGRVERIIIPDLFAALVYAVVGQLISAKAASTIWARLQNQFGEISPQTIAGQSADVIKSCGLSMSKAVCIKHIAQMITQGSFHLDELYDLPDEEVIRRLMTIKGVGKWTAEMLLIHAMERRDVVSWGDIAIRRGMMKLYGLSDISKEEFEVYRNRYSPFGSIASMYLWEISSE